MFDIWNEKNVLADTAYKNKNYKIVNHKSGGYVSFIARQMIYGIQMSRTFLKKLFFKKIGMNGRTYIVILRQKKYM